jgi:heptosyltransferase II
VLRTLIIAPQWIGDAVMSQPLLAQLAARGARLSVAALPWVAPVYRAMPDVAEVLELPFAHGRLDWSKRRSLARAWRGQFDTAYVLPNSIKSALIPWLARVPQRIGYQGEGRPWLLNQRRPNPQGRPPMVAHYSALSGQPHDTAAQPRMHFSAAELRRVTQPLGLTPQSYWAFAPGAEYGPAKCWPTRHYAALAQTLHAQHGLPIVLLGSGKEAALCQAIAQAAPGATQVLAGKTSLLDAMVLVSGARGMVSNDSGLMHVAAAFHIPQVAVFGSTSPEHTPPLNPNAKVLWLKHTQAIDCAPCFERTCRFGHTRCLSEITPGQVEAALAEVVI